MLNCRHCKTTVTGNFCSDCGRPVKIDRVDWHYIVHEIQHVLHFEKGIFYTVRELLFKPGTSIRDFITTDRSRLVKPVLFLVLTSLIYTTIEHLFHIEQGYISYSGTENSNIGVIFNWVQSHYGYANIIMGVFIAFWLKLLFRRHGYNLFEMLILLCFVMGIGMLMLSFFAIVEGLTGLRTTVLSGVVVVAYCSRAIGDFFDRKRVMSYVKALASYLLGTLSFTIVVIISEILIYLIRR
jgi:hypothetical protein